MEYVFTFEDNTKSLMHYGVRGMKWGSWNAETKARYSGAGNGTYYKKASRGNEWSKSVTDQRRRYNANQPKSKQIAKNLLLGPAGAHAYNTARSRGLSRADALTNSTLGVFYAQGVKYKQKKLGTTTPKISGAAKERADYAKDESFKKTAVKAFIAGGSGSVAYNTVKARTKSRGKAALAAAGAMLLNANTTGAAMYAPHAVARMAGKPSYSEQTNAPGFKTRTPEIKKNGKARR